jgi:hypothetical protein
LACALALWAAAAARLAAQEAGGALAGTVVSAADAMPLPDVTIRVTPAGSRGPTRRVVSDDAGAFAIAALPPGAYTIRATHTGFQPHVGPVEIRAGETATVRLALVLSPLREELRVEPGGTAFPEGAASTMAVPAQLADVAPLDGDNFTALVPVLPGVIRQPDGRLSLAGGRPEQSGLQVSEANVSDPVTGGFGIDLPSDAVESVTRFNSPYAAEYGRFSSGLVRIETRRSDNDWGVSVTGFIPSPRLRDGKVRGLSSFGPRVLIGGPLVRDRLFLTQSLQYEMRTTRVTSLPSGEDLQEVERLSAFTRLDANLDDGHDLVATFAYFPRDREFVSLGTFMPQPVTPDIRERGFQLDVTERSVIGGDLLVTSSFAWRHYNVAIEPHGHDAMVLAPEGRTGAFFHQQDRRSRSYQWIETVTRAVEGRAGTHLVKVGFDALHASYEGEADSRPIEIRRADGTLAERIEFPGTSSLRASGTDLAFFVQDRWRLTDRVLVDLGARLDRDGVVRKITLSPRAGASVSVLADGRGIVRGGIGVFADRPPLNIATFGQLESRVVTRFDGDGVSPIGPAETYRHRATLNESPTAFVWSIGYDHRIADRFVARVNHLRRKSRDEFIVAPATTAAGPTLLLSSDGLSDYKETELTVAYTGAGGLEAVGSYVIARAEGDFNSFDRYFGDLPEPVIQANARGRFDVDVPRRLVLRATAPFGRGAWLVSGLAEIRTGFPYSAVDEQQRLAGAPNGAGRFPLVATLDLAVTRRITFKGRRVFLGVRVYNVFDRFTPRDVQQNVASPLAGAFFNGVERKISVSFQLNPPSRSRE